jgi:hypothetical protein
MDMVADTGEAPWSMVQARSTHSQPHLPWMPAQPGLCLVQSAVTTRTCRLPLSRSMKHDVSCQGTRA